MTVCAVMAAINRQWEVSVASLFATIRARTPPDPTTTRVHPRIGRPN